MRRPASIIFSCSQSGQIFGGMKGPAFWCCSSTCFTVHRNSLPQSAHLVGALIGSLGEIFLRSWTTPLLSMVLLVFDPPFLFQGRCLQGRHRP